MIEGVVITTPKQFPDERGIVKHFITEDELPHFGECYVTTVYDGIRKGWHSYKTKTIHYVVPHGLVKLVLWDSRKTSPTYNQIDELFLGDVAYQRVTIPPGVMNAFKGIAKPMSLVVVVADEKFSEDRTIRIPLSNGTIIYDWDRK